MSDPKIYVACLAAYNAGTLHGSWIDAAQDADAIHEEITAMLKASPEPCAEEWAIHDFEGFGDIRLTEYESIETVAKLAALLEEHDGAFAAWYSDESRDASDDLAEMFEDAYRGEWDSEEDYAASYLDDTGFFHEIPKGIRETVEMYFDYEKWSRDLFMGGDYWSAPAPGFKVYVFDRNA